MMTAVVLAASASAVFSDLQSSTRVEMHFGAIFSCGADDEEARP